MSDVSYEPSADVTDFGVSISLDKIGLRIRSDFHVVAPIKNPVTGEFLLVQMNPEITVWSLEQAQELVSGLRRAIHALSIPD